MTGALWFVAGFMTCTFLVIILCLLRVQRDPHDSEYMRNWAKIMTLFPDD